VIKSFAHRGLKRFFEEGVGRGLNPQFLDKIERELNALDAAQDINELNLPGFGLHALTGDRSGEWSMTVTRNWRITFKFIDGHAYDVNYEDYH
jgi:toxin HigB-1